MSRLRTVMSTTWVPKAYKQYQWIVQDPELVGGHLAIRCTRLPVSLILECLVAGFDIDEIERKSNMMSLLPLAMVIFQICQG